VNVRTINERIYTWRINIVEDADDFVVLICDPNNDQNGVKIHFEDLDNIIESLRLSKKLHQKGAFDETEND
jgi:hypothetical protein